MADARPAIKIRKKEKEEDEQQQQQQQQQQNGLDDAMSHAILRGSILPLSLPGISGFPFVCVCVSSTRTP